MSALSHVSDYGAAGDGATDDRADIQQAIALTALGGTVEWDADTYLLDSNISSAALWVPRNLTFDGNGATLTVGDSVPKAVSVIRGDDLTGVTVGNFTINGNNDRADVVADDLAEDEGINFKTSSGLYVHDVELFDIGQDALDFDDCDDVLIEDADVHDVWGNAVHFGGIDPGTSNWTVRRLTAVNTAKGRAASALPHAAAFHAFNGPGVLEDSHFDDNAVGVLIDGVAHDVTIRDCTFGAHDSWVINVVGAERVVVENCIGLDDSGNPTTPFSHDPGAGTSYSVIREASGQLALAP